MPDVVHHLPDGTVIRVKSVPLPHQFTDLIQSWDLAFKGNEISSRVCGGLWATFHLALKEATTGGTTHAAAAALIGQATLNTVDQVIHHAQTDVDESGSLTVSAQMTRSG